MDRDEAFREFLKQFFKPYTRLAPSAVSQEAGFSNSQLIGFLLPEGNTARRGLPRASTLAALARVLRRKLLERARPDLADKCTVVRFFLEAGYLQIEDVAEFLQAEGVPGWVSLKVVEEVADRAISDTYESRSFWGELMREVGPVPAGGPEPAR